MRGTCNQLATAPSHFLPLSPIRQVFPRPVTPAYFAACSPYISDSLAALLHSKLKQRGLLDRSDMLAGVGSREGGRGEVGRGAKLSRPACVASCALWQRIQWKTWVCSARGFLAVRFCLPGVQST